MDPARAAALAVRDKLAARQRAAQAEYDRLASGQERLDKFMASAKSDQKAALESKKALLARRVAEAEEELEQVTADVRAVDDLETQREDLVAILARAGSKSTVAADTDVDDHAQAVGSTPGARHQTRTTTSFADGRAVTDRQEDQRTLGSDGVTQTTSRQREETTADGSRKDSTERTTQVGPGGVSLAQRSTLATTRDGKTATLETSTSTALGKDGATQTQATTLTRRDGSTTSTTNTRGIERGNGELGAGGGRTTSQTDTSNTTTTRSRQGKAGIVAGEKGLGAFAEGQGSVSSESEGGFKTGAVAGLRANIVCNVGDPEGDPPLYPLTLEVNLGAKIALSAAQAKKGAPAQGGLEVKGGAAVFLKQKRMLGQAEAAAYVQALKASSDGAKGAATYKEFAIIEAGVHQGWPVAQAMFQSGGKPLSAAMLATLARAGDSVELGGSTEVGAGASLGVKGVSVEGGVERADTHSTSVTRNAEGTLDVGMSAGSTTTVSGKVGIDPGALSGSAGRSHSVTTTTGYEITIDPKRDPGGKLLEALSACWSPADYDAFIATYGKQVTVTSKTVGHAQTDADSVSVGVGPAEIALDSHNGVAETNVVDGQGKLKSNTVVGSAGGGAEVTVGGVTLGDSVDEKATAQRDAHGHASLDLSREAATTDAGKLAQAARSKLPFANATEGANGALTTLAGGGAEAETRSHDVAGITLSNQDLERIGQIACSDWTRWRSAPRRYQEIDDWDKAGNAIKAAKGDPGVVADELARFIGGDKMARLEMVTLFIRPGGKVGTGRGYEFPDSLKALRADYERLVVGASDEKVAQAAATQGPQKAAELGQATLQALDKLLQSVTAAKDFSQPAAKAEMLSAITHRETLVRAAMRQTAGQTSSQDEAAAARQEYDALVRQCAEYEAMQNELFATLKDLLGGKDMIYVRDIDTAAPTVRQLADLIAVWNRDYAKAATIARSIGLPASPTSPAKSNMVEFNRLKKACFM